MFDLCTSSLLLTAYVHVTHYQKINRRTMKKTQFYTTSTLCSENCIHKQSTRWKAWVLRWAWENSLGIMGGDKHNDSGEAPQQVLEMGSWKFHCGIVHAIFHSLRMTTTQSNWSCLGQKRTDDPLTWQAMCSKHAREFWTKGIAGLPNPS